jgi:putative pyruvate formate lyase activating enzyme
MTCNRAAYLSLSPTELNRRVERALAALADCRACPRDCGVNRLEDRWAACKTGRYAVVSSAFPHFGEEDCLRGWNGSGPIFFSHCNLRCVFCQMDQYYPAGKVSGERFPEINRRLTSAEFREALTMARDFGLRRIDQRNPDRRLLARLALA